LLSYEGANEPDADLEGLLVRGAVALGVSLGAEEIAAFCAYREDLLRWSTRMNLTGFGTPEQIVRHGFLDSLACAPLFPSSAEQVLDVGSGAGFPAIPLSIVRPRLRFTLVEPSRKRVTFLRHIVRHLKLTNVCIRPDRIERLRSDTMLLAAFDAAVARAVASPADIGEWVRPFLRPGGVFLAQIGSGEQSGLAANRPPCRGFEVAAESDVPGEFGRPGRRIVVLRKILDR
jgi:16S rRNA (guanine527-N7)-methyltransferase